MKKALAAVTLLVFLAGADSVLARNGGSSSHSRGSHSGSSKGNSKNSHYIARSCKTSACFKKHPSGTYGFMTGQKKK